MSASFTDPSFESPAADPFGTYNPSGSAWTFSGSEPSSHDGFPQPASDGSGVAAYPSSFLYNGISYAIPDGNQVGFLQGAATISQTLLGFQAGTYALTFELSFRWNDANPPTIQVSVDGTVVGTFTPGYYTNQVFNTYTTDNFEATAGAHTITFTSLDPNGWLTTALIDLVELVVVSLDQPATTWAKPRGFVPRRRSGPMPKVRIFGGNR
jgi:hypothetical protein